MFCHGPLVAGIVRFLSCFECLAAESVVAISSSFAS